MAVVHLDMWDYVSLSIIVAFSAAVGLYHIFAARKVKNTNQFLVSSNDLGIAPLVMSIMASFFSAISFLGIPVEIYMYGVSFSLLGFSALLLAPVGMYLFLPVFFKLQKPSVFYYLELRFDKSIKMTISIMWTFRALLNLGLLTYSPALALNQVTGLHLWASVIVIGVVCIIYTSMGGIKAVVWADTIQGIIMIAVYIVIIIKGTIDVGGMDVVWDRMKEGKRDEFFIWSSSPNSRYSFWTLAIAGSTYMFSSITLNQSLMQRFLSNKTLKQAQMTYLLGCVGVAIFYIVMGFGGAVAYAYYYKCDPGLKGYIKNSDQLMPFFAVDILSFCKGLSGVFVGGIMCATLSTLSTALNSMAAVTLADYIKHFKPNLSEQHSIRAAKLLVVFYGVLGIAVVALAEYLGSVLTAAYSVVGITSGCFTAVYTVGMLFPSINSKAVVVGAISSLIIPIWAWIGQLMYRPKLGRGPLSTESCSNFTLANASNYQYKELSPLEQFYATNTLWYTCWSVVVGMLVSLIASKFKWGSQSSSTVDPDLLFPAVKNRFVNKSNPGAQEFNDVKLEPLKDNFKG